MDRLHDQNTDEVIDLGAASVETRGPLGGHEDVKGGIQPAGLSDD